MVLTYDDRVVTTLEASELERTLEQHRAELTAYCYRMLGSGFEAEDAVQETLLRAWKNIEGFEGRASLRSWLYRIATNVCLDMLSSGQRRARPMDLGAPQTGELSAGEKLSENTWILPVPDGHVLDLTVDPADLAVERDSIRLAFIAALQHLPPRQRAVLILREVLHWHAGEVAELLETSVASVNSALQRARATLSSIDVAATEPLEPADEEQRELLARYVKAFESYDMTALTALLQKDATWSMPPYPMWLQTHEDIVNWCLGPGFRCEGSRLVPTVANGMPAFGQYRPSGPGGAFEPWSLHVLEVRDGMISGISFFLDTERLFPLFGLPPTVD